MIAIDLGSNTIRFIEFDGVQWGKSFEKIVKTAESIHETKRIGGNAIERIVTAIEEAKKILDFSIHPVCAFTTAAMRLATNSQDVLDTIRSVTGISFEIIDAGREAELTLEAVRYRLSKLGNEPDPFVLADIGGGSTELIVFEKGLAHSRSLNIGIVTLAEKAVSDELLEKHISLFTETVRESVIVPENAALVLTAGTPTTISAYLLGMDYETYNPEKINGFLLKLDECHRVHKELLDMDETLRTRYVGVGRERLIGAGILMVTAIYEALGYHEAVIIDDGLREGIALNYFKSA